ncbi:hypothetical protein MUN46_009395 [Mesosutterella sp. AGMB02718]|uniref:Uncharacterized protein n=1 Tax=Mesosutterella faecium TaxID=2925194 RepID=A0ABT7IP37_9BURK|nr:hypothetical protein [Mesosutterella sp. AGMB02718]MDL2060148.1 hypothetical protein [Mesosutterella sp. AGMB02718]
MRKIFIPVFCALMLAAGAAPAEVPAPTDEQIAVYLSREMQKVDFESYYARTERLEPAEKNRVAAEAVKRLFADPDFARYAVSQLRQVGVFSMKDSAKANELSASLGRNLFSSLSDKGASRLPYEDQRALIALYLRRILTSPNSRACRAQILNDPTLASSTELAAANHLFLNGLSLQAFRAQMDRGVRATLAEVKGNPPVRRPTAAQKELADQALEKALEARLSGISDKRKLILLSALNEPRSADPGDVCEGMRLVFSAYLDLNGEVADWAYEEMFAATR